MKHNPAWNRDEVILGLDVYFACHGDLRQLRAENPKLQELSRILRSLPFHPESQRDERFRNPVGMQMVLTGFVEIDPDNPYAGIKRNAKLQKLVWDEYTWRRDYLRMVALAIRKQLPLPSGWRPVIDNDFNQFHAGSILYAVHRRFEMDASDTVRGRKRLENQLACEVCGLWPNETYRGGRLLQLHDASGIETYKNGKEPAWSNYIVVCPTCHSALHWIKEMLPCDRVREILITNE